METPAKTTRHFPRKGERFIDGQWVMEEQETKPVSHYLSPKERRDYLRMKAGWPADRNANNGYS